MSLMFPKKSKRDEKADLKVLRKVAHDETFLTPIISPIDAYLLVSALQVALSHPEMSPEMVESLRSIAMAFQDVLCALHPDVLPILEAGWSDVEANKR